MRQQQYGDFEISQPSCFQHQCRGRVMAQQFRLLALVEDPGLFPSSHMGVKKQLQGIYFPFFTSFILPGMYVVPVDRDKILTHIKHIFKNPNQNTNHSIEQQLPSYSHSSQLVSSVFVFNSQVLLTEPIQYLSPHVSLSVSLLPSVCMPHNLSSNPES